MFIKNSKVYDTLKWIALVFLPALTTFVGVVLKVLNVPNTDVIVTIMVAFDTFLGSILGLSNISYNKQAVKDAELYLGNEKEEK